MFLIFNTEKVENMNHMFYKCSQLKSIDVSDFNKDTFKKVIDESKTILNIKI